MNDLIYLKIVLDIILFIIVFYLAFLKSYFQEKGKNLATKEDIEDITEKVEKIKNDIQYSTQSKYNIISAERDSIIEIYAKYHIWYNSIQEMAELWHSEKLNENDLLNFTNYLNKVNEARLQFKLAEAKVEIFVKFNTLTRAITLITLYTKDLQDIVEKGISSLMNLGLNYRGVDPDLGNREKFIKDKRDLLNIFFDDYDKQYKEVRKMKNQLKDSILNHLQNLA